VEFLGVVRCVVAALIRGRTGVVGFCGAPFTVGRSVVLAMAKTPLFFGLMVSELGGGLVVMAGTFMASAKDLTGEQTFERCGLAVVAVVVGEANKKGEASVGTVHS